MTDDADNAARDASYLRWRQNIPYTNADIARALRLAAELRQGARRQFFSSEWLLERAAALEAGARLSKWDVKTAVGYMKLRCEVCGAVALYRFGVEGRCRAHRGVVPEWLAKWRAQKNAKNDAFAEVAHDKDRILKQRGTHRGEVAQTQRLMFGLTPPPRLR
jgi:hypothetical protein